VWNAPLPSAIQRGLGNLGDPPYFLLGKREVLAPLLGKCSLCFYKEEKVENRIERIVNLVGERRCELALR
jgi:hypothetical protein